jgi:aryl-alcohol dehydrogenase-like predicted oxidoreductase
MNFGGRTGQKESIEIIDKAIDAGVNFIDTANVYNNGKSEKIVGKALEGGKREDIVLATKVHGKMGEDVNAQGNSRRHIIMQCEQSLKRLKTDRIDLYQIHRPDSSIALDETLRALDDLIKAGKVLYAGTSTFAAWQVIESLWISRELGLNRFVTEQPPYNLLDRRIERELLPMAISFGMAVIPWSPLAGGFLTGKYKRNDKTPEGARLEDGSFHTDQKFSDDCFNIVEQLESIAQEKNCSTSQAALAWCMGREGITSPIIGPRTLSQFEDNLGALNVRLDERDYEKLDKVSKPGEKVVPYYDADFNADKYRGLV